MPWKWRRLRDDPRDPVVFAELFCRGHIRVTPERAKLTPEQREWADNAYAELAAEWVEHMTKERQHEQLYLFGEGRGDPISDDHYTPRPHTPRPPAPPPKPVAEMNLAELEACARLDVDQERAAQAHTEVMRHKYARMAFSAEMFDRHIERGGSIEDY